MKFVAIYLNMDFLKFEKFETAQERAAFCNALSLNFYSVFYNPVAPYCMGFYLPEELDTIDWDDDLRDRFNKYQKQVFGDIVE